MVNCLSNEIKEDYIKLTEEIKKSSEQVTNTLSEVRHPRNSGVGEPIIQDNKDQKNKIHAVKEENIGENDQEDLIVAIKN